MKRYWYAFQEQDGSWSSWVECSESTWLRFADTNGVQTRVTHG